MDSLLENVMDKKFLEKVRDAYQKLSLDEKAFLSMEHEYLRSRLREHGIKVPQPAKSMQSVINKMSRLRAKKKTP